MNQEQKMQWRYVELHMRMLFQQIISRPWSPIIEASGDERLLLRLFRTLPEEVQDEFLEEIGKKAFLSVCPDIEENEDEADERLGYEICSLMPDPPDYDSFKQAVETIHVPSLIFGSSRDDGETEADLAASAASYENAATYFKFSPEEVEGYIGKWREKVVAEIEWRIASKKLDGTSLDYKRREWIGSDHVADSLAQALAVVGGEIVVEFPCDRLKNKTICRETMTVVEMANDLHILLQYLQYKGSKHWSSTNVSTMTWEIADLSQDMKQDPDQSLLKQVEYRMKMIHLMETMLAGYTNSLNNPDLSKNPRPDGSVVGNAASAKTGPDAPEESASIIANEDSTNLKSRYERAAEAVVEALEATGRDLQVGPLFAGRGRVGKVIRAEPEDPMAEDPVNQIQIILANHPNQSLVQAKMEGFLKHQKQMSQDGSQKEDLSGGIVDGMQDLIDRAEY